MSAGANRFRIGLQRTAVSRSARSAFLFSHRLHLFEIALLPKHTTIPATGCLLFHTRTGGKGSPAYPEHVIATTLTVLVSLTTVYTSVITEEKAKSEAVVKSPTLE